MWPGIEPRSPGPLANTLPNKATDFGKFVSLGSCIQSCGLVESEIWALCGKEMNWAMVGGEKTNTFHSVSLVLQMKTAV